MSVKWLLAISLLGSLAGPPVHAQSTPTATDAVGSPRNPNLGDPGAKPKRPRRSAAAIARSDKQPPGTENGNQPDRASAGGGGR